MEENCTKTESFTTHKIIYFGLSTESKYLFDFYVHEGTENYGFYSDKENPLVIGSLEDGLLLLNETNNFTHVICCAKKVPHHVILQLIKYCYAQNIVLYLLPSELGKKYKNFIPTSIHRVLTLKLAPRNVHKAKNAFIKRSFDLVFSTLVIVFVLSWLFPLLWILIKLESKGPVFFIQKRNGLENKEFNCLKFRTMYLNDVSDEEQAKEGDKRISKVGKFLRKTSIDEFPQFFNVLLGDMSVVGPRPHMIKHNKMYVTLIENYNQRTVVKPGITGLAQVLGYRGETESDLFLMKIRVRMDLFYINNWSFFLDLKIIFKTVINIFIKNKNAF